MDLTAIVLLLITAVAAPGFMAYLLNRQARGNREQEWARQDALAAAALEAAGRVEKKADKVASDLKHTTSSVNQKLDTIHTLVNSDMTKQMQATLAALYSQLVLLREGKQTALRKRAIAKVQAQVAGLEKILVQRDRADEKIARRRRATGE